MSIKGFQIDGAVQRYDYTALDNKPVADATLSVSGGFADAAAVGAAVAAASQTGGGSGLTTEIKTALMNCLEHVAWIDEDGQTLLDILEDALYPPVNLVSISATYSQSGTVYDSDTLNSLKENLTVTATMDDGSTEPVDSSRYTLSGTLTVGTSTITVTYAGKTATFSVTVTAEGWTITKEIGDNYSAGCLTLSSGEVDTDDTGWYTSDFIDVPDGATSFYRTTSRESDWYMSWYDESKAFLGNALSGTYSGNGQYGGGFTDSDGNVWNVVPKGAKYFRCSWRTNATWTSVTFEQNKKLTQDVAPQYGKLYVYDYDETATGNVLNTDYIKCDGLAYAQIRPIIRRYINWYDANFVQVSQEAIENNVGNNLEIPSDAVYMKFTNTNAIGRGANQTTRIGQGLIKFTEEIVSAW